MRISGPDYIRVLKAYGKNRSAYVRELRKRYAHADFQYDKTSRTGKAVNRQAGTSRFPKEIRFSIGRDGAVEFGDAVERNPRKPWNYLSREWPDQWSQRRVAVMNCKNVDHLEELLKVETSRAVKRAINEQIKGQTEI